MTDAAEPQYWYNTRTGEVEEGKLSVSHELLGPFATREEAASAYDRLRQRAEAWAEEDAAEAAERDAGFDN